MNLSWLNLRVLTSPRFLVALFIVVMCTQFPAIEGGGVSPVKVALMALAPFIFITQTPIINKAFIWGGAYWLCCFFCAYFAGPIRWSTLIYLGMFIMTFICFYSLLRTGKVSLEWFLNLLKALIITYGIILILQQISVLLGLRNNPLINLYTNYHHFIALNKLPILNLEPSHAARMLAVFMLGFLECFKLGNNGNKITLIDLFSKEHRLMTILFLWSMLTMGSGTAFIALGLLSIYFITLKNAIYAIPIIIFIVSIGEYLNLEQLKRVEDVLLATTTGNVEEVRNVDTSAAVRINPIINFFTKSDLSDAKFWIGNGTASKLKTSNEIAFAMMNTNAQLPIIKQYGFLSMILSLILVYSCIIKKFFSIETLFFLFLFGLSLANFAYTWGAMMVFAGIRYFQEVSSDETYKYTEIIE